jgi:hypothetical protein
MFDDDVVVAPAVREHGMLVFRRDGVTSPGRGSRQEGSKGR